MLPEAKGSYTIIIAQVICKTNHEPEILSIYIAVMIPIYPKSPEINANSLCIQCLVFPATATLFTLINDHFVYY